MSPPRAASTTDKTKRLNIGDTVSVAVGAFGKEYALSRGANPWCTETVRDEGTVIGRENGKWKVRFADGEHVFDRKALSFERSVDGSTSCSVAGSRRSNPIEQDSESDDHDSMAADGPAPQQVPQPDSSDDEVDMLGEPDHEFGTRTSGFSDVRPVGDWRRDDNYAIDERARQGFTTQFGPTISGLSDWEHASLFSIGCHFLPMVYLQEMAALMQEKGAQKYAAGNKDYVNWHVSRDDVLQWIGVWIYMLAYPQAGSRRAYWTEPTGGFGPRHRLAEYVRLGENGYKGLRWFENMHACFSLPEYPNTAADPFRRTRRFWDALRDGFHAAVSCSWLMCLDESMVRWMGAGMPGLMVVLRKPTPIGLELHTLCCALSGILGESHARSVDHMRVLRTTSCVCASVHSVVRGVRRQGGDGEEGVQPRVSEVDCAHVAHGQAVLWHGPGVDRRFMVWLRCVRHRVVQVQHLLRDEREDGLQGLPQGAAACRGRRDQGQQ